MVNECLMTVDHGFQWLIGINGCLKDASWWLIIVVNVCKWLVDDG